MNSYFSFLRLGYSRVVYFAITFSLLFISTIVLSQDIYLERIYSPLIKTVKLEVTGTDFTIPIIKLGSSDRLLLKFDELSEETKRYGYKIIHCNSDWTKSELQPFEYIQGFETGYIENYANSFNTLQRYVHYWHEFPNNIMEFKLSGNYIIKVYLDDNPDNVVMVRRFMVLEDDANIRLNVMNARNPSDIRTKQELDVFVSPKNNMSFANPSIYLKVFVQQNGNRDLHLLTHRQIKSTEIEYSFKDENIFEAGNEFRNFDFSSLRTRTRNVSNIDFINGENHIRLFPDKPRANIAYMSHNDIDGYYYIRSDNAYDFNIESDYAWVHFYLPVPIDLEGSYYVWGELSDWNFSTQNKMEYSKEYNSYYSRLYLKQGFYDYMIMYKSNQSSILSPSKIEGNYSETNNKYNIYVYYRKPGDSFDSLIGFLRK